MSSKKETSSSLIIFLFLAIGGILAILNGTLRQGGLASIPEATPSPTRSFLPRSSPFPTLTPTTKPDMYGLVPLPFDSRLNWSRVAKNQQQLNNPGLYWHTITPSFEKQGDIQLAGTEWVAEETITSNQQEKNAFANTFPHSLADRGWSGGSDRIISDNTSFSTIGGGGVEGLERGFLKSLDSAYRVINYSEKQVTQSDKRGENPYPYTTTYRVFISDVFTKEFLLSQIGAKSKE